MCESLKFPDTNDEENQDIPLDQRIDLRFSRAKHQGSLEPGDCGSSSVVKPEWFNEELFKGGQLLARQRFFSLFFAHLSGLCMLVHIPSIFKTLVSTNNSRTVADTFKRYLGTLVHVKTWYEGNVWNPDDQAHKSIMQVRKMHQLVASKMNASKTLGKDVLSISQYDMFLTQFGFIGMIILHPKECGFPATGQEKEMSCLIHFWRCIGYLLGIQDLYNLFHDEKDLDMIKGLCKVIVENEFRPAISKYSAEENKLMTQAILESIKSFIRPLSVRGFTKYLYKMNTIESPVKMTGISKAGYHGISLTMKHLMSQTGVSYIFDRLLRRAIRRAQKNQDIIKERLAAHELVIEGDSSTNV